MKLWTLTLLAFLASPVTAQTPPTDAQIDHLREIMDERDRQYAQRFAAQQEALAAALNAQKEAVANALSAAKEAVNKAEDAANKRFESVNEFRQTLTDQAATLVSKDSFKALEDKVNSITARLDNTSASSAGASALWGYLLGGLGAVAIVVTIMLNIIRRQPAK